MDQSPLDPQGVTRQRTLSELSKLLDEDTRRGNESWLSTRKTLPILSPKQIPELMDAIQFTRDIASAAVSQASHGNQRFDYSKADLFLGALWGELKTLKDGGESEALQPISTTPSRRFESAEAWRLLKECGVISLQWMKKYNYPSGNKTARIIEASDNLLSIDKIRRARQLMKREGIIDKIEREFRTAVMLDVDLKYVGRPYDLVQKRHVDWMLFQVSRRAQRVKEISRLRQQRKPLSNQSLY